MPNNYFDFLEQNSTPESKGSKGGSTDEGKVNLTVRADADCQFVCDGDFLFLLNANQIVKEKAPAGQHLIQFIALEDSDAIIEKIVDWPTPGKNYLEIVSGLKDKLLEAIRIKEEAIVTIEFKARKGGKGTYTGRLKNGKPEGNGKVMFESGGEYEGDFHNGWRHGKGVQLFTDWWYVKYEGDFYEDMRTGNGVLTDMGDNIYEGEVIDGLPNGYGKLVCPDGTFYEGEFKDGEYNGKGKLTYADGDTYEGEFKNGARSGRGKYTYSNGDVVEGVWNE